MKNFLVSLVAIIIIVVLRVVASPSIEKQLKKECDQINKTCPTKLNKDLRLDKVTANGKTINYTITVMTDKYIAKYDFKKLEANIRATIKGHKEYKKIKKAKIKFNYTYLSQKGKVLHKYTFM